MHSKHFHTILLLTYPMKKALHLSTQYTRTQYISSLTPRRKALHLSTQYTRTQYISSLTPRRKALHLSTQYTRTQYISSLTPRRKALHLSTQYTCTYYLTHDEKPCIRALSTFTNLLHRKTPCISIKLAHLTLAHFLYWYICCTCELNRHTLPSLNTLGHSLFPYTNCPITVSEPYTLVNLRQLSDCNIVPDVLQHWPLIQSMYSCNYCIHIITASDYKHIHK